MPIQNLEIARILAQHADLMEIEGGNVFKIRAYRNAAQIVSGLSRSIADMVEAGEDLSRLSGIGANLANHLQEIVETGRFSELEKLAKRIPAALTDLLKVPSLGPKRVRVIYDTLQITDPRDLRRAVETGQLRELPGFGEKMEQKILEHIQTRQQGEERMRLAVAEQLVEPILRLLRHVKGVKRVVVAGSFRRRRETVGDIDILITATKRSPVMDRFCAHEDVAEVLSHGATRSSVRLRSGLQVDVRAVPEASYGAALHYFTGAKEHNVAIRTRGVKKGLKINEYGVFRKDRRIAGATEEEVFAAVDLPYIEPELRENRGEIELAARDRLPELVTLEDIRGDLQCHTTATDGRDSLEAMAEAAQAKGYAYLAVTDHSKRVAMARGLNATRLARQIKEIDRLNARLEGFRVLRSIEVDILEDGSLDLSDDILAELDLVVGAVHYGFALGREKQTERIIRAMDNPFFTILAHPTGRLINEREPYEVDVERLLAAAGERGCFLELNAHPARLDLNDIHCRMAREMGVRIAISTDAHSAAGLEYMRFGLGQARRGGLEAADVLNARPWPALRKLLART
jgi:DNA polymerase (family 10)